MSKSLIGRGCTCIAYDLLEKTDGSRPLEEVEGQLVGRSPYLQPVHVNLPQQYIGSIIKVKITDMKAHSQRQPQRFGELVVERGWLPPQTVDFFAEQYPTLGQSNRPQPLGQYLKAAALMDDDQIRTILTEQDLYGGRFGEIAVMKGWVPKGTVNLLLPPQSESERGNLNTATKTIKTALETS